MSRVENRPQKCLTDLELDNLQSRRSSKQVVCLYKEVEGLVPVIHSDNFNVKSKIKKIIKPECVVDFLCKYSKQFMYEQPKGT